MLNVTVDHSTLITQSGKTIKHVQILRFEKEGYVVKAQVNLVDLSYNLLTINGSFDFQFGGKNTLPILSLLTEVATYIEEKYGVQASATTKSSNVLSDGIRDFMGNPD